MCGIFASFVSKDVNGKNKLMLEQNSMKHRGPDGSYTKDTITNNIIAHLVFHRLAIMGLTESENDILHHDGVYLICNGEIYKHKYYAELFNLKLETQSDCEVILKMYTSYMNNRTYEETVNLWNQINYFKDAVLKLDGVFAFVLWDSKREIIFAGRDRIGIRPLFYFQNNECLAFASEEKGLLTNNNIFSDPNNSIKQFPPGHIFYALTHRYSHFEKYWEPPKLSRFDWNLSKTMIRILFTEAVKKRLVSDRPIGFLLSGGLDSSLVASVASKLLNTRITTFSIGYENSSDLLAARKVATYLNSDHHEVILKDEDIVNNLQDLIWSLGSRDITTIRASMPMYLLSRYISQNTDIKVIFSGEGSDEIFAGYLYLHKAPNRKELHEELLLLVKELYLFDVRRGDRTTARWGLEIRVPFLDADFLDFVLAMDPALKMGGNRLEKQILRDSFQEFLPDEILYRRKEAFSDGVGSRSVELLKSLAEEHKTNLSLNNSSSNSNIYNVNYAIPVTDEAKYYYDIHKSLFDDYDDTKFYWMPKWSPEVNNDPSAKFLSNY